MFAEEADMDTITSFIQEALIIKGLKHPNVIELVGVVLQRAAPPYIVTPLTRNGDLAHFLRISRATSARLQVWTKCKIFKQLVMTSFLFNTFRHGFVAQVKRYLFKTQTFVFVFRSDSNFSAAGWFRNWDLQWHGLHCSKTDCSQKSCSQELHVSIDWY